jgi:hypothetical protein
MNKKSIKEKEDVALRKTRILVLKKQILVYALVSELLVCGLMPCLARRHLPNTAHPLGNSRQHHRLPPQ